MRRIKTARNIDAGLGEVLKRIVKKIRDSELAQSMIDRVTRYFKTKDKSSDLSNKETSYLYRDVDLGEKLPLSRKRQLDFDWTSHAKYRSELRDVNPEKVMQGVRDRLREKLENQRLERKTDRLRLPGVGTAVVDYDLTKVPSQADIVTVWASKLLKVAKKLLEDEGE